MTDAQALLERVREARRPGTTNAHRRKILAEVEAFMAAPAPSLAIAAFEAIRDHVFECDEREVRRKLAAALKPKGS